MKEMKSKVLSGNCISCVDCYNKRRENGTPEEKGRTKISRNNLLMYVFFFLQSLCFSVHVDVHIDVYLIVASIMKVNNNWRFR